MPADPTVPTPPGVVHVMREHSTRPGAMRLICGANPRESYAWVKDGSEGGELGEADCPRCVAILDRESRVTTALTSVYTTEDEDE